MWPFFQAKNKITSTPSQPAGPVAQIHVMPERFYQTTPNSHRGIWLIVGFVVVAAGASIVIYFAWQSTGLSNQSVVESAQQPAVVPPTPEPPSAINTPAAPEQPTTTPPVVSTTPATSTTPENFVTPPVAPVLFRAPDVDSDGLTAVEESMYGTNVAQADTDGDGYLDGNELKSNYDPTKPKALLTSGSFFAMYQGSPSYRFIYPVRWTVTPAMDGSLNVVSSIGEGVNIITATKSVDTDLRSWILQRDPTLNQAQLLDVVINGLRGVRSSDGLNYYLMSNNQSGTVYILRYIAGSGSQLNFVTTATILIQSFQVTN